ncbi:uncharacterized protein LOC114960333 [Acropora millepora]|uniref:uncharacterized protein LOC114960333 n=1 Tax=Acropora millepora TaxID=45264 RepID=UPI001CF1CAB4|nr:uncharacterized protein LOC114960333 [Acropora millepora]
MHAKNTFGFLVILFIFEEFCLHITGFVEYDPDSIHQRSRRSVYAMSDKPQPSHEYPLVLFSGVGYDSVSDNGYYKRLKENEFIVWGRTIADQQREFRYRSMIVMPGRKLSFKAAFSSGNKFISSINNITNISNIHLWMFDNQDVGGSSGIWYTQWLHWEMGFAVKVEPCQSCLSPDCGSRTCYFGTCGADNKCQCVRGYSGENCTERPNDAINYPSIQYPLILFPNAYFTGTPKKVAPDTFEVFAQNTQSQLVYSYQSMRVLFRRKVTFSRVDHNAEKEIPIGGDIEDISSFMVMNEEVGDELWINYSSAIELSFAVKVEDVPACTNCSDTGGSCFTKRCVCLPGFSGLNCKVSA